MICILVQGRSHLKINSILFYSILCGKKMLRDSIKRHMRNVHSETNDDKDIEPAENLYNEMSPTKRDESSHGD